MNTAKIISLGCPKNRVDSERMAALLSNAGYEIVSDEFLGANYVRSTIPSGCAVHPSTEGNGAAKLNLTLINTCAFIDDAKRESIDTILEAVDEKERGEIDKIIVTGCLAERYKDEILDEFPEIDAALGVHSCNDVTEVLRWFAVGANNMQTSPIGEGDRESGGGVEAPFTSFRTSDDAGIDGARLISTPSHTAYMKISEGCDNRCTYCIIPHIRGPHRSRRVDEIVAEAWSLEARGVKEICLVAQDLTAYDGKWQSHPAPPGHPSMEGKKTDSAAPLPLCGGVAA